MNGLSRYASTEANLGRWDVIHSTAANADMVGDFQNRKIYAFMLRLIINTHPCEDCRSHGSDWVQKNPPERWFDRADGCFRHSWTFHNSVNSRIGKPIMPYSLAKRWYAPAFDNGCKVVPDPNGQMILLCEK